MQRVNFVSAMVVVTAVSAASCAPQTGKDGGTCSVADNGDGTATIRCPDGSIATFATLHDGGSPDASGALDGGRTDAAPHLDGGTDAGPADGSDPTDAAPADANEPGDSGALADAGPRYCLGHEPSAVVQGTFVLRNSLDALALGGVTCITGDLLVEMAAGLEGLAGLEQLTEVGGLVRIDSCPDLADIDVLQGLRRVGGLMIQYLPRLEAVAFPNLTSAGGVSIAETAIQSLEFPLLASADDGLSLRKNLLLVSASFPALARLGSLSVYQHSLLVDLSLPLAAQAGHVYVKDNARLTTVSLPVLNEVDTVMEIGSEDQPCAWTFPALRSIGEDLSISGASTVSMPTLASVARNMYLSQTQLTQASFPALAVVVGNIGINGNTNLVSVAFPSLNEADLLTVTSNPLLAEIQAPNLTMAAQIGASANPRLQECDLVRLCAQAGATCSPLQNNGAACSLVVCSSGACMQDCSMPSDHVCQ